MDYEKAYKSLEAKIKKAYLYAQTDSTKKVLESIIPELAESEDEKIRKALIRFYTGEYGNEVTLDGIPCTKIVVWLEKQKPVEWSEEDENRLKNLYDVIDKCDWNTASKEGFKKFLKSLKPQPKQDWKPSDEQLDIIEMILTDEAMDANIHSILETLHNDLKKLREE